jgi:CheY-like chemotaxis protein
VTPIVLAVEDDPNDSVLLDRAFGRLKAPVRLEIVADGQQALDYLAGRGNYADRYRYPFPHLLLLDIKLPRLSGLAVLEQVRAHPDTKRLPIVMLTSSDQGIDVARAYDGGANSYLVKPSEPHALRELVAALTEYWLRFNQPAEGRHG